MHHLTINKMIKYNPCIILINKLIRLLLKGGHCAQLALYAARR